MTNGHYRGYNLSMPVLFQLELAAGALQDQQKVDRLFSEHLPGGLSHLSHYPDLQWLVAYGWGNAPALLKFLTALYHSFADQPTPVSNAQVHPFAGLVHRLTFLQNNGAEPAALVEALAWLSRRLGPAVRTPIILIDGAARTPIRASAAIVLANGYRDLEERLKSIPPEFGPAHAHPRHGALLAGVAAPRWEATVDLDRQNSSAAQRVARKLRERDGGVTGLEAIARLAPEANLARVLLWCDHPRADTQRQLEKRLQQISAEENVQPGPPRVIGLSPAEVLALPRPTLAA